MQQGSERESLSSSEQHQIGKGKDLNMVLKPRTPLNYDSHIDGMCEDDWLVKSEQCKGMTGSRAMSGDSSPATENSAWADNAKQLTAWCMQCLVNRVDCWGQYLPEDQRTHGNAKTCKGTLTEQVFIQHFQAVDASDLIGLHTTSPKSTSRWFGADIDNHATADHDRKRRNRKAAIKLYNRAKALGFQPLLISSNGQGGYHLLLIFNEAVPTPTVFAFGQWFLRDWQKLGLMEQPELFPKQPALSKEVPYGNFLRLPGRHHTLDYYSSVWTGKQWVQGEDAVRIILETRGVSPKKIPPDAVEDKSFNASVIDNAPPTIMPNDLSRIQQRALALLRRKRAIQRKGGDKATWTAALYLVKDFGLSVEQALPVFKEWNATHCVPPWSEEQLIRKLNLAIKEPGRRGRLLDSESNPTMTADGHACDSSSVGNACYLTVPDFVLMDWERTKPRASRGSRGRPALTKMLYWRLFLSLVIAQRSSRIVLPDVVLGQILWGGNRPSWPRRWRQALKKLLRRLGVKKPKFTKECCPSCPLYDYTDVRHSHIRHMHYAPAELLGQLHLFQIAEDKEKKVWTYDFAEAKSHHPDPQVATQRQKLIKSARKTGQLFYIYLPGYLFGPKVLPAGPCRILEAITHELTRTSSSQRCPTPRAEVIPGNTRPGLDPGRRYVGFNGNGKKKKSHLRGTGYRVNTWMEKADYQVEVDSPTYWHDARCFLGDVQCLASRFGLIVMGQRPDVEGSEPLERLIDLTRTTAGRRWLSRCKITIFATEDYLASWRKIFADALEVSFLPGELSQNQAVRPPKPAKPLAIKSALQLDAWMRTNGMTEQQLATALGVSRPLISYYRSGSRPWSVSFQEYLTIYIESRHENDEK